MTFMMVNVAEKSTFTFYRVILFEWITPVFGPRTVQDTHAADCSGLQLSTHKWVTVIITHECLPGLLRQLEDGIHPPIS